MLCNPGSATPTPGEVKETHLWYKKSRCSRSPLVAEILEQLLHLRRSGGIGVRTQAVLENHSGRSLVPAPEQSEGQLLRGPRVVRLDLQGLAESRDRSLAVGRRALGRFTLFRIYSICRIVSSNPGCSLGRATIFC